jgi:hypothetical protein
MGNECRSLRSSMEIHIVMGLFIPVAFLAFAGMVKSLVRSDWKLYNFYLGMDIALAALANGIINIVDLAHRSEAGSIDGDFAKQMTYTALSIVISVGALFGTMGLHQRFEVPGIGKTSNLRLRRGILLGVVANVVGAVALGLFIYWKLGRIV